MMKLFSALQKILGGEKTAPGGAGSSQHTRHDFAALAADKGLKAPSCSYGWDDVFTLFCHVPLQVSRPVTHSGFSHLALSDLQMHRKITGFHRVGQSSFLKFQYADGQLEYSYQTHERGAGSLSSGKSEAIVPDSGGVFLQYIAQRQRRRELQLCERCGLPLSSSEVSRAELHHAACQHYRANTNYEAL